MALFVVSTKSKMAADGHLGCTKIAITSQPVADRRRCDVWSKVGFPAELSFLPYGLSYTHCCRA